LALLLRDLLAQFPGFLNALLPYSSAVNLVLVGDRSSEMRTFGRRTRA
jgi:hypothetical protein